jgi:uncharacterized repeat protein (TIGR01451 family)
MMKSSHSKAGIFNLRVLLAFSICSIGVFLAIASLTVGSRQAIAQTTSGARIYVTTTVQKIGGVGTGGCSLQEAIYSSVLHSSFFANYFGGHGIAIDATDPDHFIATDCVAGTGNGDTIVLPSGGMFTFNSTTHPPGYLDGDAYNPYGPTATPIIFSAITIEGNGATLQWTGGSANVRLFAVGPASVTVRDSNGNPLATLSGTGGLTLRNAYIKGFHVKGGDGSAGGGGGMGAGAAIYLQNGSLIVENSTFDSNRAVGGDGGAGEEGGGGGIWGNGGGGGTAGGGGGGGGSKGNGARGAGGGGGGTVFSARGELGGYRCGGSGGQNGQAGQCPGGGGGGGYEYTCGQVLTCEGNGANGAYAGGGGAGPGGGGSGGFGGGGGSGEIANGGNGGFGGGGGEAQNPGTGGAFGGHADSENGGGGAGLGGAIFSDSGSVTIHNSTFYNNSATQGLASTVACNCGSPASNGDGLGGAIFSHNGSLTLVDVTISGNHSSGTGGVTGSGGGVVVYSDSSAGFIIQDTIVANNGVNECFFTGNVTTSGVGNLVMSNGSGTQPFGACPGVVTTVDPQLQALEPASVNGGKTPTMAIPLYSSAMGVADPGTSLPSDQHNADRPQPDKAPRNGYDIGAFTVCRILLSTGLRTWFCSETHISPPPTTTLTMQASPSNEGTTDPAPGNSTEDLNSVVSIQALPNSGYHFTSWTGNVAQPSNPSTTVTMSQAQSVTANFDVGAPSADLQVAVSDGKSAAVAGAQNIYTIVVSNAGPSYVSGAVVKDTFPSIFTGVTFSATETGGATGFTVSGTGNIKNTVTMPPGSSITYNATGKLSAAATGTVSDTASVTAPSGISDPNLGNNNATDTDNITLKADLKVTLTDGKTSALPGSKNTYTIVVRNAGPSKVIGAVIRDTFPSTFTGVTYTATQSGGATGFSPSGSGNINNTVTMPPASTITYKATGTISASATGSISDTATVTAPSGVIDPNTANNSATDTDTL